MQILGTFNISSSTVVENIYKAPLVKKTSEVLLLCHLMYHLKLYYVFCIWHDVSFEIILFAMCCLSLYHVLFLMCHS